MTTKKKYYAVAIGRTRGIYTRWFGNTGAENQVRGFPGAVYKGFASRSAAEAFLKDHHASAKRRSAKPAHHPNSKAKATNKNDDKVPAAKKGQIVMYTDGGALKTLAREAMAW